MASDRRITKQTERILATLLTNPSSEWWGAQIAPAAGLPSGTLYPALARMERFGWLASRWEEIDPAEAGRPRRRLYHLTGEGEPAARQIVGRANARGRRRGTSRPALGSAMLGRVG
jgi:DNA-binding MarR family transcriptional regulator